MSLVCIVSGRSAYAEDLTRAWLEKHAVPFDRLILRPDDTKNEVFKVNAVRQLQEEGLSVELLFEDWAPAARYIREHTGVSVLGVNPFDPDTCLVSREQLALELAGSQEWHPEELPKPPAIMAKDIFARLAGEHL